jgi:hypothetical protein
MKKTGLLLALLATTAFGASWTGYISDSHCGVKHEDGSQGSITCVTSCIKGGAEPVLVVGGKVFKLSNPGKVAAEFYGKKVMVTGDLKGDTVTLASVAAAK